MTDYNWLHTDDEYAIFIRGKPMGHAVQGYKGGRWFFYPPDRTVDSLTTADHREIDRQLDELNGRPMTDYTTLVEWLKRAQFDPYAMGPKELDGLFETTIKALSAATVDADVISRIACKLHVYESSQAITERVAAIEIAVGELVPRKPIASFPPGGDDVAMQKVADPTCPECGAEMSVVSHLGKTAIYSHQPGSGDCLRRQLTASQAENEKLKAAMRLVGMHKIYIQKWATRDWNFCIGADWGEGKYLTAAAAALAGLEELEKEKNDA